MIKKLALIISALIILVVATAYFYLPNYTIKLVKEYDPYTFERVLLDDTMRVNYGIYDNNSPADYGFGQFEEVTYSSIHDGNNLSAWFIPASKPSSKTVLLIHGRWSNRLKTMKYLEIIKHHQLDSIYNILIPDMRNSGRSEPAETMMGYEFAEDVASSAIWLANNRSQSEVILYGFSMGGMAVVTLLNREDLMTKIREKEIIFTRIIVDSPVANVEKILLKGGENAGLPEIIVNKTLDLLDREYQGYLRKMKFSNLLSKLEIPILILQGTNDVSQPIEILQAELDQINKPNIRLETFKEGHHVKLYQVEEHKNRYSKLIGDFLIKAE